MKVLMMRRRKKDDNDDDDDDDDDDGKGNIFILLCLALLPLSITATGSKEPAWNEGREKKKCQRRSKRLARSARWHGDELPDTNTSLLQLARAAVLLPHSLRPTKSDSSVD